ncbi:MAG: hypothetical protein JW709_12855 [Sedimentisphaerales bacterium]|nr:hypothetical protein [Sedimentisphaerales bacterium]
MTKYPEEEFRAGAVSASIWSDEKEIDGKTVLIKSVRIQKSYKDNEGNWKNANYYFLDELPKLELVIRKAYEHIALKTNQE